MQKEKRNMCKSDFVRKYPLFLVKEKFHIIVFSTAGFCWVSHFVSKSHNCLVVIKKKTSDLCLSMMTFEPDIEKFADKHLG